MTTFESLSNELLYEIFDYLPSLELFEIFPNLNQRFHRLLFKSHDPLKINFIGSSREKFLGQCREILTKMSDRVIHLHLPHPCHLEEFLEEFSFNTFPHLHSLNITVFNSDRCRSLLHQIRILSSLHCLTLTVLDVDEPIRIFDLLAHLSTLKYAKIIIDTCAERCYDELPLMQQHSSIEYLEITYECSLTHLEAILPYFLSLKSLTCQAIHGPHSSVGQHAEIPIHPVRLTYLSLEIRRLPFDIFLGFLSRIARFLRELSLTIYQMFAYLDAKRWEELISERMPHLAVFDLQHVFDSLGCEHFQHTRYHALTDGFTSAFWRSKRWRFAHLCDSQWDRNCFNFFSLASNKYVEGRFHFVVTLN